MIADVQVPHHLATLPESPLTHSRRRRLGATPRRPAAADTGPAGRHGSSLIARDPGVIAEQRLGLPWWVSVAAREH